MKFLSNIYSIYSNVSYKELGERLYVSLIAFLIFKIGCLITIPFLNIDQIIQSVTDQWSVLDNTAVKALYGLSMLGGGALKKASIFTIGLQPYIIASIICRIAFAYLPYFINLKEEDSNSEKTYIKLLTLFLSILQSFTLSLFFYQSFKDTRLTTDNYLLFISINSIVFSSCSMFLYWLAKFVTSKGISQGSSLIIASDIISRLPDDLSKFFLDLNQGSISNISAYASPFMLVFLFIFICFVEYSFYNIPVEYAARQKGMAFSMPQKSFLPLKVNLSGVISAIGAFNCISLLKLGVDNLSKTFPDMIKFAIILDNSHPFYFFMLFLLTLLLSIFWSNTDYNPIKIAEYLQSDRAVIPYIRPGKPTVEFISSKLNNMIFVSALYISIISIFPGLISLLVEDELKFGSYGLSILILVTSLQESIRKIDVLLKSAEYPNLIRTFDIEDKNES